MKVEGRIEEERDKCEREGERQEGGISKASKKT
jgi:hypothetical protein